MKKYKHKDYIGYKLNFMSDLRIFEQKDSLTFKTRGNDFQKIILKIQNKKVQPLTVKTYIPGSYGREGMNHKTRYEVRNLKFFDKFFTNFLNRTIRSTNSYNDWISKKKQPLLPRHTNPNANPTAWRFGGKYAINKLIMSFLRRKRIVNIKADATKISGESIVMIGAYPILNLIDPKRNWGLRENKCLIHSIKEPLGKSRTFNELIYNLTLTKSDKFKKLLGKGLQNGHPQMMVILYTLRKLIPIDYQFEICERILNSKPSICGNDIGFIYSTPKDIIKIRKFLKRFTAQRIRKLFLSEHTGQIWHWLQDSANQFEQPGMTLEIPEKANSWMEIHDDLAKQFRLKKVKYQELQKSWINKMDGDIIGDMRVVVAKSNHQLVEWGNYMNNCIASYANRQNTTLIGLYRGDELIYNIEIVNGSLQQMRARFNKLPEPKDQKAFQTHLEKFMQNLDTKAQSVV